MILSVLEKKRDYMSSSSVVTVPESASSTVSQSSSATVTYVPVVVETITDTGTISTNIPAEEAWLPSIAVNESVNEQTQTNTHSMATNISSAELDEYHSLNSTSSFHGNLESSVDAQFATSNDAQRTGQTSVINATEFSVLDMNNVRNTDESNLQSCVQPMSIVQPSTGIVGTLCDDGISTNSQIDGNVNHVEPECNNTFDHSVNSANKKSNDMATHRNSRAKVRKVRKKANKTDSPSAVPITKIAKTEHKKKKKQNLKKGMSFADYKSGLEINTHNPLTHISVFFSGQVAYSDTSLSLCKSKEKQSYNCFRNVKFFLV